MADVSKIKLPNQEVVNIKDSRITGIDATPTSGSTNVVTSGGIYTALVSNLASKQDVINAVQVNVDGTSGTPSGSASMSGNTLQFSFSGLKGETGETGPQGPQGEQGIQGPKGETGEVQIETTLPVDGLSPNTFYRLGILAENTSFILATPEDSNILNNYMWSFRLSSTIPTITWPIGITWAGGSAPELKANTYYEISVVDGMAVYLSI